MGLSHVPTGFLAANRAYFLIAALAWNLKTWMLNLLQLGDGAVLRFKRFLYLWICQAGMVATTGRGVLLKLPAGEYYQRFGKAFSRLAALPVSTAALVSLVARRGAPRDCHRKSILPPHVDVTLFIIGLAIYSP